MFTVRKNNVNEELRKAFEDYDMLMESTGVCIVKLQYTDGFPLQWANEAAYRTIGYTKEQYEAHFGYDLRAYFKGREEMAASLEEALQNAVQYRQRRFQVLLRLPKRDGFFWAQCTGTFTDYDRVNHQPGSVYGVFTDVTAAIDTKERLMEAGKENSRLSSILDHIPAGVSVCIIENHVVTSMTVNRYLSRFLGIPSGKVILHGLDQIMSHIHNQDRPLVQVKVQQFMEGDENLDVICRLRREPEGTFLWTHIEGHIVNQSELMQTAYLTYTNITALKEAETALQEAVSSARLIVWEYHIPTHTITMSDNETTMIECKKFGFPHQFYDIPASLRDVVDEKSWPQLLEMYRKVDAGEDASCEIWYKRKASMEPRCERVSYTVEKDEAGQAVKAYGVGLNITVAKTGEERYLQEQKYQHANRDFNLVTKGHYNLTQNKVLSYTMMNELEQSSNYFKAMEEGSYDDAVEALLSMPCPPEDKEVIANAVDRQMLLKNYQEGHLLSRVKYRRLVENDLPLWMSVEMRTFASPMTGDVECFSYTYDITDKVRNEEIMNHIAQTEFDYVGLIFSKQRMFEFLQNSGNLKFGRLKEKIPYDAAVEYVEKNFIKPDQMELYHQAVNLEHIIQHLHETGRWSKNYHRSENGRITCKQMDYSWLDQNEEIILVIRTDVSSSYEQEQEQIAEMAAARLEAVKANEAKSAFLSSMSHDMRTPLNAVIGFTDLAMKENDADVKQSYLEKVQTSGRLLLDLINDTLDLSRIESGKMTLMPEAVEAKEIYHSIETALESDAEKKKIHLDAPAEEEMQHVLYVDRLKLQKILLNLLSNAIKYTPEGGTVKVRVEKLVNQESECNRRIIIEDNGIGMSPEFLPKAFEPFAQEHRKEAGNVAGTGLGLAIVQRIVHLMGGTIEVQSKPGCGTRFTVDLPITMIEKEEKEIDHEPIYLKSLQGRNVLLCEDNDLNAEIVSILLKEKGMNVDWAKDGKEGMEMFRNSIEGYYDVILMDIRMPVMDGYESAHAIRSQKRKDAPSIPIIALTADAFEENIILTKEAGMNDYLVKPIDTQKIFAALAKAMPEKEKSHGM